MNKRAPGIKLEDDSLLPYGKIELPEFREPPCFIFDRKGLRRSPQDLELYRSFWLVSDRTRAVFSEVDPDGFAFAECCVKIQDGEYFGPPHWLCNVTRVLDALDETQSTLKIAIREDPIYRDFGKKYYRLLSTDKLVFMEEVVGDAHIFRMEYLRATRICDQTLKDACKAAGLKGVTFRKL